LPFGGRTRNDAHSHALPVDQLSPTIRRFKEKPQSNQTRDGECRRGSPTDRTACHENGDAHDCEASEVPERPECPFPMSLDKGMGHSRNKHRLRGGPTRQVGREGGKRTDDTENASHMSHKDTRPFRQRVCDQIEEHAGEQQRDRKVDEHRMDVWRPCRNELRYHSTRQGEMLVHCRIASSAHAVLFPVWQEVQGFGTLYRSVAAGETNRNVWLRTLTEAMVWAICGMWHDTHALPALSAR
jgi:hypothetical protein